MPTENPDRKTPRDGPKDAAKKPTAPAKAKRDAREERLAQALKDNLRRRKAPKLESPKKED